MRPYPCSISVHVALDNECDAEFENDLDLVLENVQNIPQYSELSILGVTFQESCRFSVHVKKRLFKGNKYLHILRTLRKEGYSQGEIDKLFSALVMPKLTYGVVVY